MIYDLLKRMALGTPGTPARQEMYEDYGDVIPAQPAQAATRGLLGSGGQFGQGGLLQDPQFRRGVAFVSAGGRGQDPLSAMLQQAKIERLSTPKQPALKAAFNPRTGKTVYATNAEIRSLGLTPVPQGQVIEATPGGGFRIVPASQVRIDVEDKQKARDLTTQNNILKSLVNNMKQRVPDTPTGAVGLGFGVVESISDQASQIAESLGIKKGLQIQDESKIDAYLKSKGVTKNAANYATMKSSVINLGYALAKIQEPNNPRLSEGDILRQLQRINFGGSREVFMKSLDQILKEEQIRVGAELKGLGFNAPDFNETGNNQNKDLNNNPLDLNL